MKKLLVIRFGALGDLLHVSASLAAVKAAQPELEIHFLTAPAYQPLLAQIPGIDHVWTWDKRQGWRALFQLAGALRRTDGRCGRQAVHHPGSVSQKTDGRCGCKKKLRSRRRACGVMKLAVASVRASSKTLVGLSPLRGA